MKRIISLTAGLVIISTGTAGAASFLDAPHDPAHHIGCISCHEYPFLAWPGLPPTGPTDDDTVRNGICLRCHGPGGSAPEVRLHSHLAMGSLSHFAGWTSQCVSCHDPHFQSQMEYMSTDSNRLFLATGRVDQITVNRDDPANPTTAIAYTPLTATPQWPPAQWATKTSAGRGLIFLDDVSMPFTSREVVAADEATLTVSGELDPLRTGMTFGLLYGQLIRPGIMVNDTFRPVKFFTPWGGFVDTSASGTPNGICQVCHSQTAYWRFNGGDATHNPMERCTDCHEHTAGLAPPAGGGCIDCHNRTQDNGDNLPPGGRRAVAGEFPADNAHAHYGGTLDGQSCIVCHDQSSHKDGYIDLINPDGGPGIRFAKGSDVASDPRLSDFCMACHDADGASRLADPRNPFGNGNVPPDAASRFQGTLQWREWYGDYCFSPEGSNRPVNSHHDVGSADQAFSGAKIGCLNCHGVHNAAASQPIADPFDTSRPWTGAANGFCLSCHNGGTGPASPGYPPGVHGPVLTAHGTPLPANTPGTACGTGLVFDCAGQCVDQISITAGTGNGACNDGAALNLRCEAFSNDGGDCPSALGGIDSCSYTGDPWWVSYRWSNEAHGGNSKRDWPGYALSPPAPAYELACMDCHDAHGSYSQTNPAGNPYALRDQVDGTRFVDDGSLDGIRYPGPNWVYGTAGPVVMPVSSSGPDLSKLCVRCHADWANASNFYHGDCTACLTCHSHGQSFGGYDWASWSNDRPCP